MIFDCHWKRTCWGGLKKGAFYRGYYIYIYWNTVKGRQTASTHRKTIVAWLPHKAVKSCPYIQFKTIYSTTLPYSSIKLWSEVLNVSTVFWLTTLW
jgi:hypothetical protein